MQVRIGTRSTDLNTPLARKIDRIPYEGYKRFFVGRCAYDSPARLIPTLLMRP